jgi:uncharacterized protein YbjT (DUF2867 family)
MAVVPDPGPASPTSAPSRTEALRDPLAAILGHTQYLKRQFLNGEPVSPDAYLRALATIERAVWALEGHLRVQENGRGRRCEPGE